MVARSVTVRFASAICSSFTTLSGRMWDNHHIRLNTRFAIYKAAVLTCLYIWTRIVGFLLKPHTEDRLFPDESL